MRSNHHTPHNPETTTMTMRMLDRRFDRRTFMKLTGLAAAGAAGATLLRGLPTGVSAPRVAAAGTQHISLAATDGFTFARGSVAGPTPGAPFLPDPLAPPPFTMWGFGFRNVSGLTPTQVQAQRGKFQASAPQLWVDEYEPALANDVQINLTNLGLSVRPDLTDSHTIHWHGFRQRASVVRRRPGDVGRRPARARTSRTSTDRTTPARTCTTATSRTSSTCPWA